eukprot:CAMPEP_0114650140 /NCGR_PEP_ID=MMETSP0191-20121206/7481_1 /TAXON_ID=126664 /ORGANISM="Sorites sp." /LENGTH=98 /DNA_ID=CAMNT_0001863927 /DNA_START=9 /DNA_END=302 /DNA_ORIENTATION=-
MNDNIGIINETDGNISDVNPDSDPKQDSDSKKDKIKTRETIIREQMLKRNSIAPFDFVDNMDNIRKKSINTDVDKAIDLTIKTNEAPRDDQLTVLREW